MPWLALRQERIHGTATAAALMAIKACGLRARHPACVRMKCSRPSVHCVPLRDITMKKFISLCLRILGRRARASRHDEEVDLVQRLREAGL